MAILLLPVFWFTLGSNNSQSVDVQSHSSLVKQLSALLITSSKLFGILNSAAILNQYCTQLLFADSHICRPVQPSFPFTSTANSIHFGQNTQDCQLSSIQPSTGSRSHPPLSQHIIPSTGAQLNFSQTLPPLTSIISRLSHSNISTPTPTSHVWLHQRQHHNGTSKGQGF